MELTGTLTCNVEDGALRTIRIDGVEVLRGISTPVRDADWATLAEEDVHETENDGALRFTASVADGALDVATTYRIDPATARISATFEAHARRDIVLNRAGFTLLHQLDGVRGSALSILHPDGGETKTAFPLTVTPSQPAMNIAGLDHVVDGVTVSLRMTGDVFEMEDQRNWTDASFKTYCRPLASPRPFTLAAGETIHQTLTLSCVAGDRTPPTPPPAAAAPATKPRVALATQADWWRSGDAGVLKSSGAQALHIRAQTGEDPGWIENAMTAARSAGMDVTLEVIIDGSTAPIAALAATLAAAGHRPDRVTALSTDYMKSHQPGGPWPDGPTPSDAARAARTAFPQAGIGVGMLTYFPEFNRCRPDPDQGDFATFGTTAITHAADDLSVRQTLEALPDVFSTARGIAGKRPLRLGLCAIGMRTNPYGAATVPNPDVRRIAMAQDDPRQSTGFAAKFARDVWEAAGRAGVTELALAAPSGPFGIRRDGADLPIADAVRDCARDCARGVAT